MDNHAHLLIEVDDIPLSKIMQGIQQVFTQHYNRKNKTTGHVFEQRYKSFLCAKDAYLLQLIRYIHQNPVRSKLTGGLNYQWSSHKEYIGNPGLAEVNFL
jgi:REP element-mobilizing transposase RayT